MGKQDFESESNITPAQSEQEAGDASQQPKSYSRATGESQPQQDQSSMRPFVDRAQHVRQLDTDKYQQSKEQWERDKTLTVEVTQAGEQQEPRTYKAPRQHEAYEPEPTPLVKLVGETLVYKWKDNYRKAQNRDAQAKYRQDHPEKVKEHKEKWLEEHKEEQNARAKDRMRKLREKRRQERSQVATKQTNSSAAQKSS